ncbi:hypothetical protein HU200_020186 [Digitaria exilis]|uniref:Replication protein A subunit n=1 Tax=Digitaria exilis TaxID=1010633 RepID=A0A835KBA7_9POAL|nr:hypothetical protein HU200_020186 [Digitaria exilis]
MLQPVLQVVDVVKVGNPQRNPAAVERFRMVLSDGVHSVQCMLATTINPLVRDGAIKQGSVIHLQEFNCSTIQNRRIIIVIRVEVLQSVCGIIGNPRPYEPPNLPAPCVPLCQGTSSVSRVYVQKTIAQIKDENLWRSDKPDLIDVRAVISNVVADNFCYPACTLEFNGKRCNKKVTRNDNWAWYCGRCNQSFENCEYRYLLTCQIKDHTGTAVAIAFQEAGEAIVGYTAHELFTIRNVHQDEARFRKIMDAVLGREYLFKLTTMEETFNTEQPVKFNIVSVDKLDASDMSHRLLEEIDSLLKNFPHSTLEGASSDHSNDGYGFYRGLGSASPFRQ